MKTMGEMIAAQRRSKEMTQAELAAKLNVTDKAVSKWERDLSSPDINTIPKLAELLDISVADLLNAKNPGEKETTAAEIIELILKAVPLAMGVAVVVLSILGEMDATTAFTLLGVGMVCLSIGALSNKK